MTKQPIVIERLKLSARTYHALLRAGIETVEQLLALREPQAIKGIHTKGAAEIRLALKDYEEVPVPRKFPPRA
jgi:DNA-directed RNA polymerase alpha subunit